MVVANCGGGFGLFIYILYIKDIYKGISCLISNQANLIIQIAHGHCHLLGLLLCYYLNVSVIVSSGTVLPPFKKEIGIEMVMWVVANSGMGNCNDMGDSNGGHTLQLIWFVYTRVYIIIYSLYTLILII